MSLSIIINIATTYWTVSFVLGNVLRASHHDLISSPRSPLMYCYYPYFTCNKTEWERLSKIAQDHAFLVADPESKSTRFIRSLHSSPSPKVCLLHKVTKQDEVMSLLPVGLWSPGNGQHPSVTCQLWCPRWDRELWKQPWVLLTTPWCASGGFQRTSDMYKTHLQLTAGFEKEMQS